ncbi:Uncharacterised protein [Chlamydia trachomatis]|uniref:hypothetical protein n=1 Tax=Schaalia turicensis TaxID=131111 RepID=UPI00061D5FDF|nr:hypothetical protein [Schaalia turicensis]CRH61202.1 Uncharacterised protein [Chlamydia trachomatis]
MVLRFNPPPNWPKPPEGFTPGPGWSSDPSSPGDGQTATGYLNFMIDEEDATAQQGTFEVSAFYATPSLFMSAK